MVETNSFVYSLPCAVSVALYEEQTPPRLTALKEEWNYIG
jgi:hypothetical protein